MTCQHQIISVYSNNAKEKQICDICNLTLSEILKNERKEGAREVVNNIKDELGVRPGNVDQFLIDGFLLDEVLEDYLK